MIAALLRLQWWSLRGRIVRSLRMLRQPKYLFGVVVGVAWIGWWTVGTWWRSDMRVHVAGFQTNPELNTILELAAPLALAVVVTVGWLVPWGRLGLPFKEAELHLLLPAPISRRRLIQYGLLKSQVGILISSFFLSLFAGSGGLTDRARTFVAFWILFSIWDLNGKWRAMFLLRQRELPATNAIRRRIGLVAGFAAYWLLIGPSVRALAVRTGELMDLGGMKSLPEIVSDPSWATLEHFLMPLSFITRPLLAENWTSLLLAIPAALGVLVLHHEFVVRSRVRFEDQAIAHARRLKDKKSADRVLRRKSRSARRRAPFALPPLGAPEFAILWKNVMQRWRFSLARSAGAAVMLLIVIAIAPMMLGWHRGFYGAVMLAGAMFAVIVTLMGGMSWQNDLRSELAHLEYARTWPVPPGRLVFAEVLSPALLSFLLAAFGVGVVLAGYAGAHLQISTSPSTEMIALPLNGSELLGVPYGLALVLFATGVLPLMASACFSSAAVQNLAVLWLPAWVPQDRGRHRGVAALGQRMVFASGLGLLMLVLAIPASAMVGLAMLVQWLIGLSWSAWAFPVWGVLASVPPFIAARIMIAAGGRMWERLDASSEILESGR